MTGAALLVVLSVVGYVLLRHCCHRSHYRWDALEWQQNIFESTAVGLALFGAASLLGRFLLRASPISPGLNAVPEFLGASLPLPHSTSVVGAFTLGLSIAGIANRRWPPSRSFAIATKQHGGSLRALLLDAHSQNRPVMLTLESRKVYVGWVYIPPPLTKTSHVVILPTLSGFRDSANLAITWTTEYSPVYVDLMDRQAAGEVLETDLVHFQLVIPLDSIGSATYFDKDLYDRHFADR
jgi:hypothetical protein